MQDRLRSCSSMSRFPSDLATGKPDLFLKAIKRDGGVSDLHPWYFFQRSLYPPREQKGV